MSNGRKTLKKHQTVLTLRRLPLEVRSRSAFIIARRIQELGMELKAVASAINCTQQYARDLLQGTKIPSQGKVRDIINGLDFDNLKVDQIRTLSEEDRQQPILIAFAHHTWSDRTSQ